MHRVRQVGFEPTTSSLSVKCSNQLSYCRVPFDENVGLDFIKGVEGEDFHLGH